MLDWGGDDERIEPHAVEQVLEIRYGLNLRIQAPQVLQACLAEVAHRSQSAIGQRPEIADQIGPPIAASNYTYNNRFFHGTAASLPAVEPRPDSTKLDDIALDT